MSKEEKYWEMRYATGGDSGWCSVGELRKWRWNIIREHLSLKDKSVLDVGCGDLRFWTDVSHEDYTGIDISSVVIARNRILRPDWKFKRRDAGSWVFGMQFDVVFCFEMLFHVMSEQSLRAILHNLNRWTKGMLFISCWSERPEPFVHPHYQRHWQLEDYLHHLPDLTLVKRYVTDTGLRALYVFEKEAER